MRTISFSRPGTVLVLVALQALGSAARAPAEELTIRGSVTDAEGRGLAGARIEVASWPGRFETDLRAAGSAGAREVLATARSDRRGVYELRVPAGASFELTVSAEDRVTMASRLAHVFEEVELAPAELPAAAGLVARVVDGQGRPIADARIEVSSHGTGSWQPAPVRARTGEDGKATLAAWRERATVSAFAPGFAPAARSAQGGTVKLALVAGVARTVEVRNAEGRPAAGALVRIGPRTAWPLGLTGTDGRITVHPPPFGDLQVSAETAGGRFATRSLAAPEAGESEPAILTLADPIAVSGQVIDALARRPLAGARIWRGSEPGRFADSGRDGGFVLEVPAEPDSLGLEAQAPGFLRESLRGEVHALDGREVALRPARPLAGRVIDEQGRAVPGAAIAVRSPRLPPPEGFARSGADGRFRLRAADGELHLLEVSAPEYLPATEEGAADRDAAGELEVVLRRGLAGSGRVVDGGGRPVPGAEIGLSPRVHQSRLMLFLRWSYAPKDRATSDREGRFELPNLEPGRHDLRVKAPGFAEKSVRGVEIASGAEAVDFGTLVLEAGVAIEVRVVDPAGEPLPGAGVHWIPWKPRSPSRGFLGFPRNDGSIADAAGRFVIPDLAAGSRITIEAEREGYTTGQIAGVEVPGGAPVVLTLAPRGKIRGVVVDDLGRPVPEADVFVDYGGHGSGESCDSRGRFELDVDASDRLKISADAAEYRPVELWIEVAPGEVVDDLRLQLAPGAVVEGRVLDPDGEPVAGATVRASQHTGRLISAGGRERVTTGDDGRFRFAGLEVAPLELQASAEGFARASRRLEVEPEIQNVELRFAATYEIHGRVVDEAGLPVAGATVSAQGAGGGHGVKSDADGRFVLPGLPDGSYGLRAYQRDFAPAELDGKVEVAGGPVFGVEVRMTTGGAVAGRILGLEADRLAEVTVAAAGRRGLVDSRGRYRIEHLEPGDWTVVATEAASGRRAQSHAVLGPGEREVVADLEFVDGLTLAGRILADGEPAPGVQLETRGLDVLSAGSAWTDHLGGFRIEHLRPGRHRLAIRRQDLVLRRELELTADRDLEVELLSSGLSGRVIAADGGGAVDDARVSLLPADLDGRAAMASALAVSTDSRGVFRFAGVAAGEHVLRVDHRGYAPLEQPIELAPGDEAAGLELALERAAGATLYVRRTGGGIPRRVRVAAISGSGEPGTYRAPLFAGYVEVGEDGAVGLSNLPAGRWLLVIAAQDAGTVQRVIEAPGEAVAALPAGTRADVRVPDLFGDDELAFLTVETPEGRPFLTVPWRHQHEWIVSDGLATVEGLPPGRWRVAVRARDRSWSGTLVAPAGGGRVPVELE